MPGQLCPIFERENDEKLNLIGVWLEFPENLNIVPDEVNFLELAHIGPMLSKYLKKEKCKKIKNDETDIGRGCKFIGGGFIMGVIHPAPNEVNGKPGKDWEYEMTQNNGITICVREQLLGSSPKVNRKQWWQFWK